MNTIWNRSFGIVGIILLTVLLQACTTTGTTTGYNLPPRKDIIADPEPKPRIPANASVDFIALEYSAAFIRANKRLTDGAINYENMAATVAAKR